MDNHLMMINANIQDEGSWPSWYDGIKGRHQYPNIKSLIMSLQKGLQHYRGILEVERSDTTIEFRESWQLYQRIPVVFSQEKGYFKGDALTYQWMNNIQLSPQEILIICSFVIFTVLAHHVLGYHYLYTNWQLPANTPCHSWLYFLCLANGETHSAQQSSGQMKKCYITFAIQC